MIRIQSKQQAALLFACVTAAVLLSYTLRQVVTMPDSDYGILWPTTGLLTGILLATERRFWIGIVSLFVGFDVLLFKLSGVGDTPLVGVLESLLGYGIIVLACLFARHRHCNGLRLDRLSPDLRDFLALAIGISVLMGLKAHVFAVFSGGRPAGIASGSEWALYELLSLLAIVPAILAWVSPTSRYTSLASRRAVVELSSIGILLALILGSGLFGPPNTGTITYHFVWAPVLWAVFRFDLRVAAIIILLTACFTSWHLVELVEAQAGIVGERPFLRVAVAAYLGFAATVVLILNALIFGGKVILTEFSRARSLVGQLVGTIDATVWVYNVPKRKFEFLDFSESERWWAEPVLTNPDAWTDKLHPSDKEFSSARWQGIVHGVLERPVSTIFRLQMDDGTTVWKRTLTTPAPADDDQRYMGIVIDVTDEQKLNEEMQRLTEIIHESDKLHAIGALSAGLSHDWNNLIMVMAAEADNLRDHATDPARVDASAGIIDEIVEQGRGITSQLLELARRDQDRSGRCDVQLEVSKASNLLQRAMPGNIILRTRINCSSEQIVACANPDLSQIVLNLGINARDAIGQDRGTVCIEVDGPISGDIHGHPQTVVTLTVSDDGTGIDEDTLKRVFEPLFTTKPDGHGTGLGLAVVKSIVNSIGGEIRIESEPGNGTNVIVTLPLANASKHQEI